MSNLGACERAQTKSRHAGSFVWMKACAEQLECDSPSNFRYTLFNKLDNVFLQIMEISVQIWGFCYGPMM